MSKYIDANAFISDKLTRYCSNCDRRKSNDGKRFVYAIGEAPCRSCSIGDMVDEIDDYPASDVREVIFCGDCINKGQYKCRYNNMWVDSTDYCSHAIKKRGNENDDNKM